MKVSCSRNALRRLDLIVQFIEQDDPLAALDWADRVLTRADDLAMHPESGHRPREFPNGPFREIDIDKYRLIYRVRSDLGLVRILTLFRGDRELRIDELNDADA